LIIACGGGGGRTASVGEPPDRDAGVRERFDTAATVAAPDTEPVREPPPVTLAYGQVGAKIVCPTCTATLEQVGADFHAGSTLQDNYPLYGPKRAFDGDPTTAWCEGEEDLGEGIGIEVTFQQPVQLAGMYILGGYFEDRATLAQNARIAAAQILVSGPRAVDVGFPDPTILGVDNLTGEPFTDRGKWFERVRSTPAMWTPPEEWKDDEGKVITEFVSVTIKDAYRGSKYEDDCISEINLVIAPTMDPAVGADTQDH